MYVHKLRVTLSGPEGERPCPLRALDSFAMRSFTGETRFDDTLPLADGWLEAGSRVPLPALREALQDWLRRKSYLHPGETVRLEDAPAGTMKACACDSCC
ncbi:MAG: hypothetical protein ACRD04_02845 [Terriglobales bacterium]